MKKKEILIIFLLAVLVTGGSWFVVEVTWEIAPMMAWTMHYKGWPLPVLLGKPGNFNEFLIQAVFILLDIFFWFLVLAALYHVGYRVKRWVKKKLKGGKMKAEVFKNEKS